MIEKCDVTFPVVNIDDVLLVDAVDCCAVAPGEHQPAVVIETWHSIPLEDEQQIIVSAR